MDMPPAIICESPRAVDGDTLRCANLDRSVRLLGIDAPELPGHCRRGRVCTPGDAAASTRALAGLLSYGPVQIHAAGLDRYGRTLARVSTGTGDASCAMLSMRAALPRYSRISCY